MHHVQSLLGVSGKVQDLQQLAQGYVVPERFTHGSSEQRVRWFSTGLENGSFGVCNTFGAGTL